VLIPATSQAVPVGTPIGAQGFAGTQNPSLNTTASCNGRIVVATTVNNSATNRATRVTINGTTVSSPDGFAGPSFTTSAWSLAGAFASGVTVQAFFPNSTDKHGIMVYCMTGLANGGAFDTKGPTTLTGPISSSTNESGSPLFSVTTPTGEITFVVLMVAGAALDTIGPSTNWGSADQTANATIAVQGYHLAGSGASVPFGPPDATASRTYSAEYFTYKDAPAASTRSCNMSLGVFSC
jgi:hypothetical protein